MKKIALLLLFIATPCYAQTSQRVDHGISAILSSVIRNGMNVAAGGRFDAREMANEMIYIGGSEVNNQVYDSYYEGIREQHRQDALEMEYKAWAEREDRKNNRNDKEEMFKKRYYGR